MAYLLNLIYLLLLVSLSPWIAYQAIRTGKYREGFWAKLAGSVPIRTSSCPCVWIHAVSLGEVNLLAPLLAELRSRHADWDFAISTTTKTGYELARRRYPDYTVFYCPLDFTWAVKRALSRLRPTALVLAELELWPNLISQAHSRGIKVAIVNGRLSTRSFKGYQRVRRLLRPLMQRIDLIAAQHDDYAQRFVKLGALPSTVRVTGSMKFDNAETNRNNDATKRLAELARFQPDDVVWLAGSTQAPEEELVLATFAKLGSQYPALRLLLVPRHPERFEQVAELLDASGLHWSRRSLLNGSPSAVVERVLLVDTTGELGAWWGTATIAFVGGSIGTRGGQNMIEPAAYGTAVSFGPNTRNFRDVVAALLDHEAAVVVADGAAMTEFVERCLRDVQFAEGLQSRAKQFVSTQLGATRRTADLLDQLLGQGKKDSGNFAKAA